MLHSPFDLEAQAKHWQRDALHRAHYARLVDQACGRRPFWNGAGGVGQFVAALRDRVALVWSARIPVGAELIDADEAAVPDFSMIVLAEEPRAIPARRPARAAGPYAAMVVIARSANVPLSRQPGEVSEGVASISSPHSKD